MKYVKSEMNVNRAHWAQQAVELFEDLTGTDREDALCDLLCDLMHFAEQHDLGFEGQLLRGRKHFVEECKGED